MSTELESTPSPAADRPQSGPGSGPADPSAETRRIALLPGDGVGVEVTREARKVLEAAASRFALPIEMQTFPWSADHYLETGETLPDGMLDTFRDEWSAIFIGAFGDARVPDMRHARDILLGIRFGLDLYINFRPVKAYSARLCPLEGKTADQVDMVIFRENTEGAYVDMGGNFKKGTADEIAVQEEIHTRKGVERIIRAAFEHARWRLATRGRAKVTMVDKSNVMRYGHGLWLRCFAEVATEYPGIEIEHMYADTLALQMVRMPEHFDVVVTNNMFGDIITDLGAALQGGLGLAASANLHPGQVSMFEPVHGSAPDLAGSDRANPMGAVLSAALMLDHLGFEPAARALEAAVCEALEEGTCTEDVGGDEGTTAVGDRLAELVATAPLAADDAGEGAAESLLSVPRPLERND